MKAHPKSFADYKADGHFWITLAKGQYYPDYLIDANKLYTPYLETFGKLVTVSISSEQLFREIMGLKEPGARVQLARIFRKYVSPETPVEMLKKKTKTEQIIEQFGTGFRPIQEVQRAFSTRPIPDETLSALLWEYKDRGLKGYDQTEQFFLLFRTQFPDLLLRGPERAGADILLTKTFTDYPIKRPVDFIIYKDEISETEENVLVVGFARYDSDRGGAQEDDRIGGYANCADEILTFAQSRGLNLKVLFLNDGPGLLLGTMWNDYASLERRWPGKIMVLTLRMVPERLSMHWLLS
ncbi:MAG: bstEII [Ktedonobacteraceae bacterium]